MTTDDAWAPPTPPSAPAEPAPRAPRDTPPRIDGYLDLEEVARGGDSVVYRARQDGLGRVVAIKVISVPDEATRARFERELQITLDLGRQHPHIVTVLATTTTADGAPCLVMDFHDLGSLHDRVRAAGPLPTSEVVAAGTACADALAFAHAHGVLHRDVKPQNVLLLPTSYVLTDFGIARLADAEHTGTLDRFSYRHASPQVLDGMEPTAADDVWSLGSTLFTLLEGRAPFASDDPSDDTALAYLRRVRTGQRRPITRADAPAELASVIERCLVADREQRTITAAQVRDELVATRTEARSWAPAEREEAADGAPSPLHGAGPVLAPGPVDGQPAPGPPAATPAPAGPGPDPLRASGPPSPASAPQPLAPSALAHLGTERAAADEHTALRPDRTDPSVPEASGDPAAPGAAEPGRGAAGRAPLPRVLSFVLGALVVGGILGIGSAWLSRDDAPTEPAPTASAPPSPVEVPTADAAVPPNDGDLQALTSNPDLEPREVVAVDDGTSILYTWDDPSGGEVTTLVVDPADVPAALAQVPAGTSRFRLEGVDPNAPEVCVVLVALRLTDVNDQGISDPVCVER